MFKQADTPCVFDSSISVHPFKASSWVRTCLRKKNVGFLNYFLLLFFFFNCINRYSSSLTRYWRFWPFHSGFGKIFCAYKFYCIKILYLETAELSTKFFMAFSISRQPLIITKIPGNTDDTGRLTPRKKNWLRI